MKRLNLFFWMLMILVSQSHGQVWEKAILLGSDEYAVRLLSNKSPTNNLFLFGDFTGLEFQIGDTSLSSLGKKDFYLMKMTQQLEIIKLKQFGGIGQDLISDICSDNDQHIYISGYFTDSIQLDNLKLKSVGGVDGFVAKLNSNFDVIWARSYGSKVDDSRIGLGGVVCDQNNNVYVTGTFSDGFSNNPLLVEDTSIKAIGLLNTFLIKFNTAGTLLSVADIGSINNEVYPRNARCTADSNILFVTNSTAGIRFKDYKFVNPYFGHSAYLVKLSNDYQSLKWVFPFYTMEFGTIDISSIETNDEGDTYVVGNYYCKAIQIGNGSKRFVDNFWLNGIEMFIAKIDANGNLVWAFNAGGGSNDNAEDIHISSENRIVITGNYTERCFYNGDTIGYIGQLGTNGFVLEIDSNGKSNYFATVGKTGSVQVHSIKALEEGNVIISGTSGAGQLRFDGLDPITITNKNTRFLAKGNLNNETVSVGNDLSKANSVELVYPNPFYDELMLHCAQSQLNTRYRITDVNGKLYAKDRLINNTTIIKTTSWPSGIYFVEIIAEDGSKTQTKIIKLE